MKSINTTITNNSDNTKEWASPEVTELGVEGTSQLPPPDPEQEIS